ncbi:MAG: amidohydrolase [Bulleidia sp.]|nr:amidohydrolase [Bulleidia sp.]
MEHIHPLIESDERNLYTLGEELFAMPELGWKEYRTRDRILAFCRENGITEIQHYGETGLIISIGSGKPHIGLIAEMDAIPTPGHPQEDPETHAAHSCGHSTQTAIMLEAMKVLKEELKERTGTVTLYCTPAEEFTDMAFRKQYVADGKAKAVCGKIAMLMDHVFDDADVLIHCHAMGAYAGHRFALGSTLAGFEYQEITFHGTASHAAVSPDKGCNALNMFALFQSAVGMLRETFVDEDKNRVHGIIIKGGATVNSIPDEVVYACYLRSFSKDNLELLRKKVDNAAMCCAKALGGTATFETMEGDLPFHQCEELNEVIHHAMLRHTTEDQILKGEMSVAAGDIGNVGCVKPTIQFGYTGFEGYCHGKTMCVKDPFEVYAVPCDIVVSSVLELLEQPQEVEYIKECFRQKHPEAL